MEYSGAGGCGDGQNSESQALMLLLEAQFGFHPPLVLEATLTDSAMMNKRSRPAWTDRAVSGRHARTHLLASKLAASLSSSNCSAGNSGLGSTCGLDKTALDKSACRQPEQRTATEQGLTMSTALDMTHLSALFFWRGRGNDDAAATRAQPTGGASRAQRHAHFDLPDESSRADESCRQPEPPTSVSTSSIEESSRLDASSSMVDSRTEALSTSGEGSTPLQSPTRGRLRSVSKRLAARRSGGGGGGGGGHAGGEAGGALSNDVIGKGKGGSARGWRKFCKWLKETSAEWFREWLTSLRDPVLYTVRAERSLLGKEELREAENLARHSVVQRFSGVGWEDGAWHHAHDLHATGGSPHRTITNQRRGRFSAMTPNSPARRRLSAAGLSFASGRWKTHMNMDGKWQMHAEMRQQTRQRTNYSTRSLWATETAAGDPYHVQGEQESLADVLGVASAWVSMLEAMSEASVRATPFARLLVEAFCSQSDSIVWGALLFNHMMNADVRAHARGGPCARERMRAPLETPRP